MGRTTLDIIPVETDKISYRDVLQLSENRINEFLNKMGIQSKLKLNIKIYDGTINLDSKFEWTDIRADIWFEIEGIEGEISAECNIMEGNVSDPWWRLNEYLKQEKKNKTILDFDKKIEKAKRLNRYWTLRCDSDESGIIHLSYGLIAASIAELTGGFIDSCNGAWIYDEFPAESQDFLKSYFITDSKERIGVVDSISIYYAKKHLKEIPQEITNANKV